VTTSSAGRGARLRELGATRVLDRRGEDGDGTGALTGYDVVLDVVAGEGLPEAGRGRTPTVDPAR
jgi:NADPH2:quinone reductase